MERTHHWADEARAPPRPLPSLHETRTPPQTLTPLRGGKRDRGPFTVLARELSATRGIRELHLKRSQAQREEARELAREKAREVLHLARQVGACVHVAADGPGPMRAQGPLHEGSTTAVGAVDSVEEADRCCAARCEASSHIQEERHRASSAIIPRKDHATFCGRPDDSQNVHVLKFQDTSIRALLGCAQPLARNDGQQTFSPLTVDLEPFGAVRPERQLVVYRPTGRTSSRPRGRDTAQERVAVVNCRADERIEEIADDEGQPQEGAAGCLRARDEEVCGAMDTD